jgi:hypothetical protein
MSGSIPARDRFLAIPVAEREAQDLLYLAEFHLAAGRRDEGRAALRNLLAKHPKSSSAPAARTRLDEAR